jgi:hypothetical protein
MELSSRIVDHTGKGILAGRWNQLDISVPNGRLGQLGACPEFSFHVPD